MKKKILLPVMLISAVVIIGAAPERSSSGAPGGHTGAPGEQTCATSGCHDDNAVNSGAALLSIEMDKTVLDYSPGKTYSLKVKVADAGVDRFGFQLLALDNASSESAGTFQITDVARTQVVTTQVYSNRSYVTYTFNGTDGTSGQSEWTVDWTAPSTGSGNVTFYAAAVSADDDMSDKGDHVYTASKTLNRTINTSSK